jgi:hypothetical protein
MYFISPWKPQPKSFLPVDNASLIANQVTKACLGMEKGNQTKDYLSTIFRFNTNSIPSRWARIHIIFLSRSTNAEDLYHQKKPNSTYSEYLQADQKEHASNFFDHRWSTYSEYISLMAESKWAFSLL